MRVLLKETNPDGELVGAAVLVPATGLTGNPSPEVRDELESLILESIEEAGLTNVESIEQRDVLSFGGTMFPEPFDVEFILQVLEHVGEALASIDVVWKVWNILKSKLGKRFGRSTADSAEMTAIFTMSGDETARHQIVEKFGVPGAELKPVSTGFHGTNGQYVYRGDDGSIFTVNVDSSAGIAMHIVRTWPDD